MMHKGDCMFHVEQNRQVEVRASGPFTVIEVIGGKQIRVIGPNNANDRVFRFVAMVEMDLQVLCSDHVILDYRVKTLPPRKEKLSPLPVEIPVGASRPETLTEIVARMVYSALEAEKASPERETWDEANDFEVDDWEDEAFDTAYTVRELREEEPFFPDNRPNSDVRPKSDARTNRESDGHPGENAGFPSDDRPESDVRPNPDARTNSDVHPKPPGPLPAEHNPKDVPASGSEAQHANARWRQ